MRQMQRHQQTTGGIVTRGRGVASQEALAKDNKMQRCRRTGSGSMTRGGGSNGQEVVA